MDVSELQPAQPTGMSSIRVLVCAAANIGLRFVRGFTTTQETQQANLTISSSSCTSSIAFGKDTQQYLQATRDAILVIRTSFPDYVLLLLEGNDPTLTTERSRT